MKINDKISSEGKMKLTIRLFMNKVDESKKEEMFCSLKQKQSKNVKRKLMTDLYKKLDDKGKDEEKS